MRNSQKLFPAVLAATVAACGLFTPGASVGEKVEAVRDKTVQICSYLPKAESVEAMILAASGSTAISGVNELAQAICTAVTLWQAQGWKGQEQGTGLVTICPRVNGVCVEGAFVDQPKGE